MRCEASDYLMSQHTELLYGNKVYEVCLGCNEYVLYLLLLNSYPKMYKLSVSIDLWMNKMKYFVVYRKWESPLLHGLSLLSALYDLLDDIWLHLL